jgi:hypothetical protein
LRAMLVMTASTGITRVAPCNYPKLVELLPRIVLYSKNNESTFAEHQ